MKKHNRINGYTITNVYIPRMVLKIHNLIKKDLLTLTYQLNGYFLFSQFQFDGASRKLRYKN